MKPTIAIVGRPNVGKSTLFNRLTGRRDALVSDLPGLTRDRREGDADLLGQKVRLVDTAGLEEAPTGSIASRMRQQSEEALRQADLALFVIDSREGIVPADEVFARIVRAAGKPAILVANKCEGRSGTDGFYEAFKLGLGDPVPISAEHGEGIGELVTDALAALGLSPVARKKHEDDATSDVTVDGGTDRPIRVAIVGRPNAGKSTLVNAILGEDRMITGPEPGLTRDSIASEAEIGGRAVKVFDTAGLRRKARISETAEKLSASDAIRAIRFAEVVVLVVDAERALEHQDLTIGDLVTEEGRALVVAINKWDLVENKQAKLKELRERVGEKLAQVEGVAFVTISALSGRGLDRLGAAIVQAYETWNRRVSTSDLNRWLTEATQRHAPPQSKGRRIKLRYMTQPSSRPPTFVVFCSQPADLPNAYHRYLIRGLRETFGLAGTPIRLSLRKGENPYEGRAKPRRGGR